MGFGASPRLAIRENGAIVPREAACHHIFRHTLVHVLLLHICSERLCRFHVIQYPILQSKEPLG
jgi:hypothetical protein